MHRDPDLSAVVIRHVEPKLQTPLENLLKKRIDLLNSSLASCLNTRLADLNYSDITAKKQKLSDHVSIMLPRSSEVSPKHGIDVYSMLLNDAKKFEERVNINDAVLINTFTKAIFRYTLHELSSQAELSPSQDHGLSFFRAFASKYYGRISSTEDMKSLWTTNENEGVWLTTCKRIYKEYSTRFFSSEKIMTRWIESKLICDVIQKIYVKYREFFGKSLASPELFYHIVPILTSSRC